MVSHAPILSRGIDQLELTMSRQKLSVVIMTLNEEELLQRCLDSVTFADQILLVDSGSTDGTIDIARRNGADIIVQPWLGWPQQRNFCNRSAKYDWVLMLEADEVVTDELRQSIQQALAGDPDPRDGFAVDRRGEIMGAMLPNMKRKSKLLGFCRLYNRLHSRYDDSQSVHEDIIVEGKCHLLNGYLLHWRPTDITSLVNQNNRYSSMEAKLFDSQDIKPTISKVIFRPILRFGWCYFVCGGYKLGMRGFIYSALKAIFDFLAYSKLWELHQTPLKPEYDMSKKIPAPSAPREKAYELAS
jgi:glycosyltransferase involved in cell wall biosynthesis